MPEAGDRIRRRFKDDAPLLAVRGATLPDVMRCNRLHLGASRHVHVYGGFCQLLGLGLRSNRRGHHRNRHEAGEQCFIHRVGCEGRAMGLRQPQRLGAFYASAMQYSSKASISLDLSNMASTPSSWQRLRTSKVA